MISVAEETHKHPSVESYYALEFKIQECSNANYQRKNIVQPVHCVVTRKSELDTIMRMRSCGSAYF